MALTNKLKAIADAIRAKTGSSEKLSLDGMASAIASISTGGGGTPSFAFKDAELQGLFKDGRLKDLHDIGYTTSNITNLSGAYDSMAKADVNIPTINLANSASSGGRSYINMERAFYGVGSNATVSIVNSDLPWSGNGIFEQWTSYGNGFKKITITNGRPTLLLDSNFYGAGNALFNYNTVLEEIPDLHFSTSSNASNSTMDFNNLFAFCYYLKHRPDEITVD